ncbi:MAG: 50S ribosomal protein L23 [Chromatiales bacterium]|nr:50S ribosomal protein L23 [Gammaproteobacteria bacterium]MCP5352014.1 50S ribosomal protein L23 [Chromatiales bacterium]
MNDRLYKVLLGPHVSEKSTMVGDTGNQVVFKVANDATKTDVKAAVEAMFQVKVDNVTVANVKGKNKRFGQRHGKRSDWKKAYVRLAEGQDIEFGAAG